MRAITLRKKYPDFWVAVEAAVWYDLQSINNDKRRKKVFNMHPDHAKRIAYNAAFSATHEHHKSLRGN